MTRAFGQRVRYADAAMRANPLAFLLSLLLCAGCYGALGPGPNPDDGADDDDDDDASDDDDTTEDPPFGLTCLPITQTVSNTWGNTLTLQLEAEEFDHDGNSTPVEDGSWSLISGGGSVNSDGLFTSFGDHGGVSLVQVQVLSTSAVCEIVIEIEGSDNVSGDPDLPTAIDSASVDSDDGCAAQFTYPLAGAVMPGSFPPPLVQWDANGNDAHALTLSSEYTTITVYTFSDSYQVTDAYWNSLTEWDPGTVVTMSLVSGDWNGSGFTGDVCTAEEALELEVTDFDLNGTIVYWEPSIVQGLKRIDFGSTSNADFPVTALTCVGCHGVNLANPNRLAIADQLSVQVVDASDPTNPVVTSDFSRSGAAGAMNDDGTRMIRSNMLSFGGGDLILEDVDANGATINTLPTGGAGQAFANWSPDGTTVVYGACDSGSSEYGATNCSLRTIESGSGDTWSNDQSLLDAGADENLYYPVISPDSDWVVYNRAVGTGDAHDSYDNPAGELWIIDLDGAGDPIFMDAATALGDKNSWPKFAPEVPGDYTWMAFSTNRPYGNTTDDISQIWLAALDLSAAAAGEDPSFAPVWLPGQSITAGSYIPVWIPRYTP